MPREPTLSIRVLWPFVSAARSDPRFLAVLEGMGVTSRDLADRDRRIPCGKAMTALARAVEELGDPALGLRAGDFQEGTFDAIEHTWRYERDLGAAMRITQRYGRLLHEGMDTWLEVTGDQARWCCSVRVPQPPAANDFLIAAMLTFARRHCVAYWPPGEIHLMHDEPAYSAEYARFFETRVLFGMPYNAIVIDATSLSIPLRSHNRALAEASEQHTEELARSLVLDGSVTEQVRNAIVGHRPLGSLNMADTARSLDMSIATLRRKLAAEGADFSTILDGVRQEAATRHLMQRNLSVTDVAFLLSFSDVRAFCRAFKRWTGKTPLSFRRST